MIFIIIVGLIILIPLFIILVSLILTSIGLFFFFWILFTIIPFFIWGENAAAVGSLIGFPLSIIMVFISFAIFGMKYSDK